MAAERLSMRKIREVLRLRALGQSAGSIGRSLNIGENTVRRYLRRAAAGANGTRREDWRNRSWSSARARAAGRAPPGGGPAVTLGQEACGASEQGCLSWSTSSHCRGRASLLNGVLRRGGSRFGTSTDCHAPKMDAI
jgi:hypothetical protein